MHAFRIRGNPCIRRTVVGRRDDQLCVGNIARLVATQSQIQLSRGSRVAERWLRLGRDDAHAGASICECQGLSFRDLPRTDYEQANAIGVDHDRDPRIGRR